MITVSFLEYADLFQFEKDTLFVIFIFEPTYIGEIHE